MSAPKTLVDRKCVELAEHFLGDVPSYEASSSMEASRMSHDLATDIQRTVEDWFRSRGP